MEVLGVSTDVITEHFQASKAAIAARVDEILDACKAKDFDRLASYHLDGPKFSKFDDVEPLDRQDAETAMRAEIEQFSAIEDLDAVIENLKVDVFGPVAVATGVFEGSYRVDKETGAFKTRTTLVFVHDGGEWLIAHEHHSPFVASA
jgi:ketosteroid isomerase-like protein